MSPPFEVKYIQIEYLSKTYLNKGIANKVKVSKDPIPVDKIGDYDYSIEAITYSKLDSGEGGQLAFRWLDKTINTPPYFSDKTHEKELIPITIPDTEDVWWIEDGEKKEVKDQYGNKHFWRVSRIFQTPGKSKVTLGDYSCQIYISSLSFSYGQLHRYLDDFKLTLFEIITSKNSHVTAEFKTREIKIINQEYLIYLRDFIEFVKKISASPKVELREAQTLHNYKKVRPIPKTFMEIATQGVKKQLTSRDYIESYDVAENRYIHFALNRISNDFKRQNNLVQREKEKINAEINRLNQRLAQFSDKITLPQESCENHLLDLMKKSKIEDQKLDSINNIMVFPSFYTSKEPKAHNGSKTLFINLTGQVRRYNNQIQIYGTAKKEKEDDWYEVPVNNTIEFQFDYNLFDGFFQQNTEYEINAVIEKNKVFYEKKNWTKHVRRFTHVNNVAPIHT